MKRCETRKTERRAAKSNYATMTVNKTTNVVKHGNTAATRYHSSSVPFARKHIMGQQITEQTNNEERNRKAARAIRLNDREAERQGKAEENQPNALWHASEKRRGDAYVAPQTTATRTHSCKNKWAVQEHNKNHDCISRFNSGHKHANTQQFSTRGRNYGAQRRENENATNPGARQQNEHKDRNTAVQVHSQKQANKRQDTRSPCADSPAARPAQANEHTAAQTPLHKHKYKYDVR